MKYAPLTNRIGGESAEAWNIHYEGVKRKHQGEDIILLSLGDPNFETPSQITDAAIASLRAGDTHYTHAAGDVELRSLIAERHERRTGQSVKADQVVILSGAQGSLFCAMQCILDIGDEVIIPEPMYLTYEAVIGTTGATIVNVPMHASRHFHVAASDIEAAVTEKTRAILINNPHNPTGANLSRFELEGIAEICRVHDLWLVCDEVYTSLTFEGQHISPCGLPGMSERTITINSLSKSHAMTGWRMGWVIGPDMLAKHVANMALCTVYGSPLFIQEAAKVALADNTATEEMKQAYQQRRDFIHKRLSQVDGLDCHLPEAGMFMMVDIRKTGLTSQAFAEKLLDFGVAVLSGGAFGPSAEGYIRLSLSISDEDLAKACDRLAECGTIPNDKFAF